MTPHPHPQSHSRRVTVRRSAAVFTAMLVIGATPLVAQALDDESLPSTAPAVVSSTPDIDTTTIPELTGPEPVAPDTAAPDTAAPDTAAPDTAAPDTSAPDPTVEPVTAPAASEEAERIDQDEQVAAMLEAATAAPSLSALPALPPGPSASAWAALRECESGGDYTITNPSGRYRGAYQFARSTWDSVAGRHLPWLVGVDPAAASPSDQDAMAYALYTERGASPWPHCGRHLR